MLHITSPNEPYPTPASAVAATTSHTQGNFRISSRKLPISKSGPIEDMSAQLGIPVPEMIFGDNLVAVTHLPSGWTVAFDAFGALDCVDKTGRDMLQVAHARDWSLSRERTSAGIKEVVRPFDWSYSSTYRGTVAGSFAAATVHANADTSAAREGSQTEVEGGEEDNDRKKKEKEEEEKKKKGKVDGGKAPSLPEAGDGPSPMPDRGSAGGRPQRTLSPTTKPIPIELLKRRDPILFHDEVILYESELDDNGVSMYSVKVRVMEQRMLLLARLFMRLDGVLVRARDTRVYVDFVTQEVTREYTAREDGFDNVKRSLMRTGLLPDAVIVAMRDANQVANLLPVVEQQLESVQLSS